MSISREEIRAIFAQVKNNSAKLARCDCHEFALVPGEPNPFRQKYRCTKCTGEIRNVDFQWYARGVADGAKLAKVK